MEQVLGWRSPWLSAAGRGYPAAGATGEAPRKLRGVTMSTWEQRERPVLEAIAALEEVGEEATYDRVAAATGLDQPVVGRTMKRLYQAGFIAADDATSMGDEYPVFIGAELLERGLRVVGQWPPDVSDAFIQRLDALIATVTDPADRARLERLKIGSG